MEKGRISGLLLFCTSLVLATFTTYGDDEMKRRTAGQEHENVSVNLFPGDTSFETGDENWFGCRSVDSTAFDGKYSLELDGASERNARSSLYYNLLEKDQLYVFSLYAKASAAGTRFDIGVNNLYYQTFLYKTFTLDTEWKRCVIVIPKQEKVQDFYLDLKLNSDAKIWIDAIQLEKGNKVSEYSRSEKISLGLGNTGAPGNLLFEDELVPELEFCVVSGIPEKQGLKISFETVDYSGKIIYEWKKDLFLGPKEGLSRRKTPAMEKMALGYFVSTMTLSGKDMEPIIRRVPFGVLPRPLPEEHFPESFFGMHAGRVTLEALKRIGVAWIRHFSTWRQGEKEKGTIKVLDEYYDSYLKHGFSIMDCVKAQDCPKWAIGPDGKLKDIEDYASYCRRYVEKLKGKVKYWEIENEPDLDFVRKFGIPLKEAAEYYADVVNSAGPAIKQVDPEASVLAISNSGMESNFCEMAIQRCAGSFDVMTIHPYTGTRYIGPGSTSIAPETYLRKKILGFVDILKKYGKGQKLWIDELGWGLDNREGYLSEYTRRYSDYVARTMIICRSVPEAEHLMWFKAQGCYEKQYYQYGLWRSEFEPLPAAVFYANIAKILCTAKPTRTIFHGDVQAYAFRKKNGDTVIAVWKYQGSMNEMALDLPERSTSLIDILGRSISEVRKDGKLIVPLSGSPVFLCISGMEPEKACELVSGASINMEPVMLSLSMNRDGVISGTVFNNYPREQKVEVYPKGNSAGISPERIQLVLPADGKQDFSFKVPPLGEGNKAKYVFECSSPDGKISREMAIEASPCNLAVRKDLLKSENSIKLADRKYIYPPDPGIAWQSPEDLGCVFNIGWDKDFFYFSADVTDKVFYQKSESYQAWNGDSIQLSFDTLNDSRENEFQYDDDDVEFIVWLSPRGTARIAKTYSSKKDECGADVPDAKVSVTRTGNITGYRVALPWKTLGKLEPVNGRIFGFNFIVNNNDGNGRNYWLGLTNGIGEVKYPFIYRKFMIVDKVE